ncbi:MAG: acylphosphatase [Planctomycetales bacterium]|nr:acylphosphatase [Planctomycetales bacterium]
MQRLSVRYRGRVQGVGFRATVADTARAFAVTGRVCNVQDGSVDLLAEGEEAELHRFQQEILRRLSRNIVDHQERWSEVVEPSWPDFGIGRDLPR